MGDGGQTRRNASETNRLLGAFFHGNGRWQPNYSGILGNLASGGISNLYYPKTDRGVALTFENALIRTGSNAIANLVQEFLIRKLTPHVPNADLAQSQSTISKE